jgi:hypothetical protein
MTAQKRNDLHSGLSVIPGPVRPGGRRGAGERERAEEAARIAESCLFLTGPFHRYRQISDDDQRDWQPVGERAVRLLKRNVRRRQQAALGHARYTPVGVSQKDAVPDGYPRGHVADRD